MSRFIKVGGLSAIGFWFIVATTPIMRAEESKAVFGHKIPMFNEVFIKVFRSFIDEMSIDQLRTTSTRLSDSERASISYFLGEKGHSRVKVGLTPEKQAFLDEKYNVHAKVQPADFKKVFPHLIALTGNNLKIEQWRGLIWKFTPEEMASQHFYLGTPGRNILYKELSLDKVAVLIDHIEDWVMLEAGKNRMKEINDYTSIFYKQERLGDKLQGQEKILLKYREKPKSSYMKWLDGPWKGREVLYNEALFGAGWGRVRESGALGMLPVTVPFNNDIFKRGTNHKLTEVGFKYLIERNEQDFRKAKPGDIKRINYGMVDLDGKKVYKLETILPKDTSRGFYCYRMVQYIDFLLDLDVKAEVYGFDNQLKESFYYTEIKINPGLGDSDFDPKNPDYRLK